MSSRRFPWIVVLPALTVPLLFAWFTDHAWEDYFITLRSSRNLVEGHGLVFTPGERVHTFTSPLGVLLPALCTWIVGPAREALALWLFRLIGAAALAGAALLVWRRADTTRLGRCGRAVFFGLFIADAKLIDFSINGMETAILVFFTLWLWNELEAPEAPRPLPLALACAGLMWTRPDAFLLGAALIVPHVVIRTREDGQRRVAWSGLRRGLLLGVLLYLPWLIFAWWYYGSPVPHTIVAKSLVTPPLDWVKWLSLPWRTLVGDSMLMDLFLPSYWSYGGWPSHLPLFGHALSVIAGFAWLVPQLPAPARRVSLAVFLGMFYLCAIILFPWYSPPWMALAALAVAYTIDAAMPAAARRARWQLPLLLRVALTLALLIQVGILLATAWQMRHQQRIVENGVRRPIGEWLRANADPRDTVFLEPLGYVSYFSRLKTYDFPGLSSPEVVAAVRGGAWRFTQVVERLRPTWLVLRPFEFADATRPENAVLREYQLVRTWDVRVQLDAIRFLPGRNWLEHDAEVRVYRRTATAPRAQSSGAPSRD